MKNSLFAALYLGTCLITISACSKSSSQFDASGSFEAVEVIVSAEQTGKILNLDLEEGQTLEANTIVGQIDISTLNIQKDQIQATIEAIGQKVNDANPQIQILQSQISTQKAQIQTLNQQLEVLDKEVLRTQKLVSADAATPKQLDDLNGQKSVLQKQIAAAQEQIGVLNAQILSAKENIAIQNRGILSEIGPNQKRISMIDDQIGRGQIKNPFKGTVLTKYAMAGEFTTTGKALYKLADLSTITLRAYISGDQLAKVKLNQTVKVATDDGNGGYTTTDGVITWINDKAEFTPKTIQTKNERANMVYAIKVKVKNDGTYKIGMYGEIKFN